MKIELLPLLQRFQGWRLWTMLAIGHVLVVELTVSVMDWLLKGEVTADYLLTGLVALAIVAPPVLMLMAYLLRELTRQQRTSLDSLRTNEQQLRTILENVDAYIYLKDTQGRYLFANRPVRELWGVELGEIVGFGDEKFFDAATAARIRRNDRRVLDEGLSLRIEETNSLPLSGRTMIYQSTKLPLRGEDGRIYALCGISTDISARKEAEQALAERETQLRTLIEAVPDSIQFKDGEGRWLVANSVCLRLFGLEGRSWEGLSDTEIGHRYPHLTDGLAACTASDTMAWASGATLYRTEECVVDNQGGAIHFDVIKVPLFDEQHQRRAMVVIGRDISARKRAETALLESRNLLQTVIDTVPLRVFWKDLNLRYLGCNPAFARDAGKTHPGELIGQDDFGMAWADQAGLYREDDHRIIESGIAKLDYEEPQTTPDGREIWLRTSKVPLRNSDNEVIGVLGIYEDITQSRRLAQSLHQREQYQRALLDNFPFMVWLKDEQSRFLAVNQAFAVGFGWPSPPSLIGRNDLDIAPLDLAEAYRADDRVVLESGRPRQVEEQIEINGRRVWFETYKSPVSIEGRIIGTVGFARDITDRKRVEEHLNIAAEVSQILFWELDFLTGQLHYDHTRLPILGMEVDAGLDTLIRWIESVHPEDRGDFLARVEQAVQPDGDPIFDYEYRIANKAGHYLWIHTRARVIQRGSAGQPILAVGTTMNIMARKQSEEAIRISEEHARNLANMLRLMCDNVQDMIWAKDLEGRYLFTNKAICEQLLNATDTEEPIGKTDLFFAQRERDSHPEAPQWHSFGELCQDSDAITLQRGKASIFEESGNIRGHLLVLEVHKSPFLNERGELIGTVGSGRDITERKRMDAELERHRRHLEELVEQRTSALLQTEARASHILHSSADGLYGIDAKGYITFINPAACKMLGYQAQQVIGRSAHTIFHHRRADGSDYPVEDCHCHNAMHSGQEVRVDDEVFWHADGHSIPVMYAVHPMPRNDQSLGAVISFVDMSVQRAAAQAREQALIAAEHLVRTRSEFLANMSHEIRTPLNGVLGFAEIGYRNYRNSDKARHAFEKILGSGKLLLGVINEILDFSKIEAGKLGIEQTEVVLAEVIDHAVEIVRERARAKALELRLQLAPDLPRTCLGDPLRIGQILLNLLSNAVKFTEAGRIGLSVSLDGDRLLFQVTDTGIGMSEGQLEQLFNPFQQGDGSTTRRFGGTGLGLAISKRLLDLMGGETQVESRPGFGSRFAFWLPYVQVAMDGPPSQSSEPEKIDKPLAGLTILVAEDDEINQMVLKENLSEDGARVVMVANGREAIERLIQDGYRTYDLVLMDVQMPEMDGYEATRRILELAPDLPIIGQTAHAFTEEREKCFAAGMVGHIAKPLDPEALVRLIREQLPSSKS